MRIVLGRRHEQRQYHLLKISAQLALQLRDQILQNWFIYLLRILLLRIVHGIIKTIIRNDKINSKS